MVRMFEQSGKTWGSRVILPTDKDLPGLKFSFLSESLREKHGTILEVGCSAGRHVRSLRNTLEGLECFGCDIDSLSVTKGHRVCSEINFVVGDGTRLPYKENSFDAVTFMDFLEHVYDPSRTMDEAARVLKPGGIITAFVPCEGNRLSLYYAFFKLFGFNVKNPAGGHVQFFTEEEVVDLVRRKGLDIKRVEYSYHLLGALFDFVFFLMVYLSKKIGDLWWSSNKYYQESYGAWGNLLSRFFNSILEVTNRLAYYESLSLRHVSAFACGIHFVALKHLDEENDPLRNLRPNIVSAHCS